MQINEKTVLIPHDGSGLAGRVAEVGESVLAPGTNVVLVHIDTSGQDDVSGVSETANSLKARGLNVRRLDKRASDAAGALLDIINEVSPDLVLMTTHGRSGAGRFVRGSVAERMLRKCPVPLLMINPSVQESFGFRSVLMPLDASEQSFEIIAPLLNLVAHPNTNVTLLFVDFDDPTDTAELRDKRREQRKADISGWFRDARSEFAAAGLDNTLRIEHGVAAEKILEVADEAQYDLLAMTTHGRSGVARWAFGSVAEKVLGACSKPILLRRVR